MSSSKSKSKGKDEIKIYSNNDFKWAMPAFSCILYDEKKKRLFWSAEQMAAYYKSNNKEYKKQILESVSSKQLRFLSSDRNMNSNGFTITDDWSDDKWKLKLYKKIQILKFKCNPLLAKFLADTEKRSIIYDAPFDNFLGTGRDGKGSNHLGGILSDLRKKIKDGEK